jgi:hypothetical protein
LRQQFVGRLARQYGNVYVQRVLAPVPDLTGQHEAARIGLAPAVSVMRDTVSSQDSGGGARVSMPGDEHEQEADRVADQVMRMTAPAGAPSISTVSGVSIRRCAACGRSASSGSAAPHQGEERSEELCPACAAAQRAALLQAKEVPGATTTVTPDIQRMIEGMRGGGQPLDAGTRAYMEPRFGRSFADVRIHTDARAGTIARAINALAFTVGPDIGFGEDQYQSMTDRGQRLVAHELTHVVQLGAASPAVHRSALDTGAGHTQSSPVRVGMTDHVVQRWPGDGMLPPGDCPWQTYLALRGAVETAKALVAGLGACQPGDSCVLLATKIAAITAEIAARVALDTTCFRGGDAGHRQQVQDKINMVNRCWQAFTNSNCPQQLLEAMKKVVERALEVIAMVAIAVVAVAVVIALIVAIIALAEVIAAVIAAAAAAAAEAAAVGAAAAAVIMLLMLIKDNLSPEQSPPTA